ncbi:MAG: cell wall hydrolase [Kiloniellales bacterium]
MQISGKYPGGLARRLRRFWVAGCAIVIFGGSLPWAGQATAEVNGIDVQREVECLALTIYFEARGESAKGKLAVGHVVMNRAADPGFPGQICEVVKQGGEQFRYRCQFTWWCDGLSDQPAEWQAWEASKALARRIYWNYSSDPTGGALWYHADYVRPPWHNSLSRGPKIGRHIFYVAPSSLGDKQPPGPLGPGVHAGTAFDN